MCDWGVIGGDWGGREVLISKTALSLNFFWMETARVKSEGAGKDENLTLK